jgi:hypothetical protein
MHQIIAQDQYGGDKREIFFDYYPDLCPVCHFSAKIERDAVGHLFPEDHHRLQIIFTCPRLTCGSYFIVQYAARSELGRPTTIGNRYFQERIFPNIPKSLDIPEQVAKVSPRFVTIANQANAAEVHSLDDVAGMAYRKALEFLIKDYCIKCHADKESEIRKAPLMQCINAYVSDSNVKKCAIRAAWLGNDETHYDRIWTNHDIKDLKLLIKLTQSWIDTELLTSHYVNEMDSSKPRRDGTS